MKDHIRELMEDTFRKFWVDTTGDENNTESDEEIEYANKMYDTLILEIIEIVKNNK